MKKFGGRICRGVMLTPVFALLALLFASSAGAAVPTYWVNVGGVTTGTCDEANPCQLQYALALINTNHGYPAGRIDINIKAGAYYTLDGLKSGLLSLIPSGSDDNNRVIFKAIDGPKTVSFSDSIACERSGNCGAGGGLTVAQLQGPNCGGQDCIGPPTPEDCQAAGYSLGGYPGNCWCGSTCSTQVVRDRSGQKRETVLELYGLSEASRNSVRYVRFDGIKFDARGVFHNIMRDTVRWDHQLFARYFQFWNFEFLNTAGSALAQPGIGGTDGGAADGSPYGDQYKGISWEHEADCTGGKCVEGPKVCSNHEFKDGKIANIGVPFAQLTIGGVLARKHRAFVFLHGAYMHAGCNTWDNVEFTNIAGFGAAPDGPSNVIKNSFIHDNNGCAQMGGGYGHVFQNNICYQNVIGIQALSMGSAVPLSVSQLHRIQNNTLVRGSPPGMGGATIVGISVQNGWHGSYIENNIIDGFERGITSEACGSANPITDPVCHYTDPNIVRNNLIRTVAPGNEIIETDYHSGTAPRRIPLTLSANVLNQNPLLVSVPVDFSIPTSSPARNIGFTNLSNCTISVCGPTRDYLGNTRPFDDASPSPPDTLDAGAFEYCSGGGCTAAPTTAAVAIVSTGAVVSLSWTGGAGCTASSPQSTPVSMTCPLGVSFAFTIPATSGNNVLLASSGCTSFSGSTCNLAALSGAASISLNYGPQPNVCGQPKPLSAGRRVRVCEPTLRVWTHWSASGTLIGDQTQNTFGTVLPDAFGTFAGTDYYNVNFDSGFDGWVTNKGVLTTDEAAPAVLTVTATNPLPLTGARVAISPVDQSGAGDCPGTPCTRTYVAAEAKEVTLIAEPTSAGANFSDWSAPCHVKLTTAVLNDTCQITMTQAAAANAVYVKPGVPANTSATLAIALSGAIASGAPMTFNPPSTSGQTTCNAPCALLFDQNITVTVTAALTAGQASYTLWTMGCSDLNGPACSVVMSGDKSATVNYVAGSNRRSALDFSNVQGQAGWTYRDGSGLLTYDKQNGRWAGANGVLIAPNSLLHPAIASSAVARWTAPATFTANIAGNAKDFDIGGGDGVTVSIVKNGSTTLMTGVVVNGDTTGINFNLTAAITAGDTIDFIVAPRSTNTYDTTSFDAIISPAPTPGGSGTVGVGSGVLIGNGVAVGF